MKVDMKITFDGEEIIVSITPKTTGNKIEMEVLDDIGTIIEEYLNEKYRNNVNENDGEDIEDEEDEEDDNMNENRIETNKKNADRVNSAKMFLSDFTRAKEHMERVDSVVSFERVLGMMPKLKSHFKKIKVEETT